MTPARAGTRLGPYEILSSIGAGGMGEVFRARDTRLNREVAIKVSREQFSERSEREARAVAALNHPNICTLHDVGPNYLVMELIEGPTLADRIAEGPIPLDEALAIAKQIAEALDAAHEKGIVHRDLKPGNIKLRPDGTVKVLDFGLAKSVAESPAVTSDSPTLGNSATHAGLILGTAAYMAPEQARGKAVDKRADIWAFGVVLYEMLTGKRLFEGEDLTETLAAVVKSDPDLTPAPVAARRLIESCIRKEPKKRLRDIGDWAQLLNQSASEIPPRKKKRLWSTVGAAIAGAALAGALVWFLLRPPEDRVVRLSVPLPPGAVPSYLDISPDGRRLLLGLLTENSLQLYTRQLDSDQLRPLAGTANARDPFWSPDGRFIGFFANDKLKIIPAAGGPVRALCDSTGLGAGGTWNEAGAILYSTPSGGLGQVTAEGGRCVAVGEDDPANPRSFPRFLPDGRHFFYVLARSGERNGVYLATLENPTGRRLLADVSSVVYSAPGKHQDKALLLFLREGALMAQPFDSGKFETVGDPWPVANDASFSMSTSARLMAVAASNDGTLVYVSGRTSESQLISFDRGGQELGRIGERFDFGGSALSPDGKLLAARHRSGGGLWLYDLAHNAFGSPLLGSERDSRGLVWSPDSSRVLTSMNGPEGPGIYQINVTNREERLLLKQENAGPNGTPSDWSRNGRFIVFTGVNPKTQADIWYMELASGMPSGPPVELPGVPAIEGQGQLSPDGKWLAYASFESGGIEIYVRAFPSGRSVWRVSAAGGREPRWSADGREIFYRVGANPSELLSVSFEPDGHGGALIGRPRALFAVPSPSFVIRSNAWNYCVDPAGRRFVIATLANNEPRVNVILNWQAELKK